MIDLSASSSGRFSDQITSTILTCLHSFTARNTDLMGRTSPEGLDLPELGHQ